MTTKSSSVVVTNEKDEILLVREKTPEFGLYQQENSSRVKQTIKVRYVKLGSKLDTKLKLNR